VIYTDTAQTFIMVVGGLIMMGLCEYTVNTQFAKGLINVGSSVLIRMLSLWFLST